MIHIHEVEGSNPSASTDFFESFMSKLENLANSLEALKQELFKCGRELIIQSGIKAYLFFALALNLANWLGARHIYANIGQPRMALHYSVDFGIDLYGDRGHIFVIPLLGLVFIVFNAALLLAITIYNKRDSRFLAHLLLASVVIANIALLIALFTVYLINFR